jgi:PAS domain S-box-containing protein
MFKNLTIRSRLIFILSFLVIFLLGIEMLGLFGMSNAIGGLKTVYHDRAIPLKQVADIESLLLQNHLAITSALMMPTPEVIQSRTAAVDKDLEEMSQLWQAYMSTYLTPEEKALATQFAEDRDKFIAQGVKAAVAALRANEIGEAYRILVEKIRPLYKPVDISLKALFKLQLDEISHEYTREQNRFETIRTMLIASIAIALMLAALIGVMLSNAIFRPLENLVDIARHVAAGNLTQEIKVRSRDEIGQLMQALKEMRDSLVDTIGQVRESEAHTRALLNNLIDGVASVNEQGVIRTFNPAGERIFGYTEKEIIGQNIGLLFSGPAPGKSWQTDYFKNLPDTQKSKALGMTREAEGLRKDGTTFPMDLAVVEMHDGNHNMFVGIMRDISERKLVEEQKTRLMNDLESANEELKSFAYVVSHDLKAPLRAIGALADWLSTDYADKFDDEGKEHMRLLVSRVHRMGNLIDGILQYSRVGRVREALVAVDLSRVVREVIDLLSPLPNVTISVETPLPTLVTEPTRMQQIFQNLFSNAIKYADKPQCAIRVACSAEDEYWKFSVTDNGPGIESRHFDRIFQLFQTLAPRDRIESTGVGLTLVKKIVEMYGGRIWIESVIGQGATFFFTLPQTLPVINLSRGIET